MNCYKKVLFLLLLVTFSCSITTELKAQESILSELSELYLNKLIAVARDNYPRIKSFNSQVNAAKNDVSAVKSSWLEPLNFQYAARSNNTQANLVNVTTQDLLTGYQFGISISPGALLSKPSQVKKAKEQVKIAEYNLQEYLLTLETEVKKRYFSYIQAQKSLKPAIDAFLDAESNFKIVKLAYQKAEVSLNDYNESSIMYNQSYTTKLQAETNVLLTKASLEELTVKKLEEIK